MSYKKYLRNFILIIILCFAEMTAINYVIDPLGYVRPDARHSYYSSERELKSTMISRGRYDGLLMGSSKTSYIPVEKINYKGKILNAAFSGARPEEILYFLKHQKTDVKWIALGLDWFMFNEKFSPYLSDDDMDEFYEKTPLMIARYLMSLDTAKFSIGTIYNILKGTPPIFTASGSRNPAAIRDLDPKDPGQDRQKLLRDLKETHYKDFDLSKRRMEDMKKISDLARQRGIPLIVWMQPVQEDVETLLKEETGGNFTKLPTIFKKQFPVFINLTGAYPEAEYYFRKDLLHYYPALGEKFFNHDILPLLPKQAGEK